MPPGVPAKQHLHARVRCSTSAKREGRIDVAGGTAAGKRAMPHDVTSGMKNAFDGAAHACRGARARIGACRGARCVAGAVEIVADRAHDAQVRAASIVDGGVIGVSRNGHDDAAPS